MPWIVLGLCVWFAARGVRAALKPDGSDFTIYWDAGRAVLAGQDPNTVEGWIYPPGAVFAFVPFALLPLAAAAALFQALSLAALLWAARECVALVRRAGLPTPPWLAWLPLLCVLRLADSNLTYGQVNHFTFAALTAALRAGQLGARRAAGAWVGAAAALKLVPGLLALQFLLRRSWRQLAWTGLVFAALFAVLPALAFGPAEWLARVAGWWRGLVQPYASGGRELLAAREYVPGQSLPAALYRLLAGTPGTSRGLSGPTASILQLDPEVVRWIVHAAQLAVLAGLCATLLRSQRDGRPGARLREAALCMLAAVLLAPLVHKAHMVWVVLPYTLLLSGAPPDLRPWARRARWTLVVLSVLLVGVTTPALLGRALATAVLARSYVGFGVLLAALALALDVWCARNDAARSPEGAGGAARAG